MIEVIVVGEGPTEETFIRDVLAPATAQRNISLQPRLIATSKGAVGGALTRAECTHFHTWLQRLERLPPLR